jgi:MOSC domain-containing protein YiiM
MKLLAINLAAVRQVPYRGRLVSTGIYKTPVGETRIRVSQTGIEGDRQIDRKNHGGPDKAIYVYSADNYRYWEVLLQQEHFPFGQFGENFTVSEMLDDQVHIGDAFRIGPLVVEVTQPRVPCFKLGIKMARPEFVKEFLTSGRTGFYLRVLEEGSVEAGCEIARIREHPSKLTVAESMLARLPGPKQRETIERALAIVELSAAWRSDLSQRLKAL